MQVIVAVEKTIIYNQQNSWEISSAKILGNPGRKILMPNFLCQGDNLQKKQWKTTKSSQEPLFHVRYVSQCSKHMYIKFSHMKMSPLSMPHVRKIAYMKQISVRLDLISGVVWKFHPSLILYHSLFIKPLALGQPFYFEVSSSV